MEMRKFLQGSIIFLLTLYGNIPQHQKEKSLDVINDTIKENFHHLYLLDSAWNENFSKLLRSLPNEKLHRSILSNSSINSHQEFVLQNRKFVNRTVYNLLLLETKTTNSEFKRAQYNDELKTLETIPIVNISCENKKYHHTNIFKMAHSGIMDGNSKSAENENDIWNNVDIFENHVKDSDKNILKNYTQNTAKRLLYNMKPTKSSLFQYFISSQPLVLDNFYTTTEFHHIKEDDMVLEKDDFQRNQLFDAFRIASSYEILIGISNFDQRIMVSSNAVLLEGSFTSSESRTDKTKDNFFKVSSSNNKEDSTSLGTTPVMSISDYSEISGSSSESVSEIDESTNSQLFMNSYEHSSSPLLEATFASFRHSHSIYSTSPVLEPIVRSTLSSYATFDDFS